MKHRVEADKDGTIRHIFEVTASEITQHIPAPPHGRNYVETILVGLMMINDKCLEVKGK